MKRILSLIICFMMTVLSVPTVKAQEEIMPFDVEAKSAVLMDAKTGTVLYAKEPDTPLPPASVTKIMTLLLVFEEIDSGKMKMSDMVYVSEYAASMGGSQVFLEAGEEMTVEDMLKSVVISSANDAAVALAETVAGSEEAFVDRMNKRAAELFMKNTSFENVTGLDDDTKNHTISAYDIAIASRELITKHPTILKYSSIWMDTIRNGEFGLTNTNRLIRFYNGATGLKTGSTSKAGFCISATAKRDGIHLIAVVMGSETRDIRNNTAKKLLDFGFANYTVYEKKKCDGEPIKVMKGTAESVKTEIRSFSALLDKESADKVEIKTEYKGKITAPVKKGDTLGTASYFADGKLIGKADIVAKESIKEIGFADILIRMIRAYFLQ